MVGEGESGRDDSERWAASKLCEVSKAIVKGLNFIPCAMEELLAEFQAFLKVHWLVCGE